LLSISGPPVSNTYRNQRRRNRVRGRTVESRQ
jgi:hypothetical protein